MNKDIKDIAPFIIKELDSNFPGMLNEDTRYNVVNALKQQALGTYTIRYTIQVENGTNKVTTGYPELIENLTKFTGEKVLIHMFLNEETFVLFFTDLGQKRVIGYLTNSR